MPIQAVLEHQRTLHKKCVQVKEKALTVALCKLLTEDQDI
jgi:hypothetical protein